MKPFFLNVDKPAGITSFGVVRKVRGILGIKKVGHLGTLDPLATGVLPLAIGKATKLIQYIQPDQKEYITEIKLGWNSTTCDREGELSELVDFAEFGQLELEAKLAEFIGEIDQVPPRVSAIKVEGKRAYDLARKGEDFELKSRKVFVERIDLIDFNWPLVKLRIVCGKGFYVRSLARDIGGYVESLQRTRVGIFDQDNWVTLDALQRSAEIGRVTMLDAWADRAKYILTAGEWRTLQQGQFVRVRELVTEPVVAGVLDGEMVCLLESVPNLPGMLKMKVGLV